MAVDNVIDRTALAAVASPAGKVAFLMEPGREGLFEFQTGNFAANVASDTFQGLYVASSSVSAGLGCWVRVWDGVNGHPEWFGARPGVAAFDSQPALTACVSLCPTTRLAAAPYYIQQKWVINTPYRKVRGAGAGGAANNQGGVSIIVATFASDDTILMGPTTAPATSAAYLDEIELSGFDIARTVPRIPPVGGLIENCFAAVRCQFNKRCFVSNISCRNYSAGFVLFGTIYLKMRDCLAYVNSEATTPVNDLWVGYYAVSKQLSPDVGLPGGNASLYLQCCSAIREGGTLTDSLGIFIGGTSPTYAAWFTDIFIENFETAGLNKGIVLLGGPVQGTNNDCYIRHPILDACATRGIEINGVSGTGSVQLDQPYVTMLSSGVEAILINQSDGLVNIIGGEINGLVAATAPIGLRINASSKVGVSRLTITDHARPVVVVGLAGGNIDVMCDNSHTTNTTGAVCSVATSSRTSFKMAVGGIPGAFRTGISIDTASSGCTLDVTGIGDGLTTDRILRNGLAIVTQGNVNGHTIINPGTSITV